MMKKVFIILFLFHLPTFAVAQASDPEFAASDTLNLQEMLRGEGSDFSNRWSAGSQVTIPYMSGTLAREVKRRNYLSSMDSLLEDRETSEELANLITMDEDESKVAIDFAQDSYELSVNFGHPEVETSNAYARRLDIRTVIRDMFWSELSELLGNGYTWDEFSANDDRLQEDLFYFIQKSAARAVNQCEDQSDQVCAISLSESNQARIANRFIDAEPEAEDVFRITLEEGTLYRIYTECGNSDTVMSIDVGGNEYYDDDGGQNLCSSLDIMGSGDQATITIRNFLEYPNEPGTFDLIINGLSASRSSSAASDPCASDDPLITEESIEKREFEITPMSQLREDRRTALGLPESNYHFDIRLRVNVVGDGLEMEAILGLKDDNDSRQVITAISGTTEITDRESLIDDLEEIIAVFSSSADDDERSHEFLRGLIEARDVITAQSSNLRETIQEMAQETINRAYAYLARYFADKRFDLQERQRRQALELLIEFRNQRCKLEQARKNASFELRFIGWENDFAGLTAMMINADRDDSFLAEAVEVERVSETDQYFAPEDAKSLSELSSVFRPTPRILDIRSMRLSKDSLVRKEDPKEEGDALRRSENESLRRRICADAVESPHLAGSAQSTLTTEIRKCIQDLQKHDVLFIKFPERLGNLPPLVLQYDVAGSQQADDSDELIDENENVPLWSVNLPYYERVRTKYYTSQSAEGDSRTLRDLVIWIDLRQWVNKVYRETSQLTFAGMPEPGEWSGVKFTVSPLPEFTLDIPNRDKLKRIQCSRTLANYGNFLEGGWRDSCLNPRAETQGDEITATRLDHAMRMVPATTISSSGTGNNRIEGEQDEAFGRGLDFTWYQLPFETWNIGFTEQGIPVNEGIVCEDDVDCTMSVRPVGLTSHQFRLTSDLKGQSGRDDLPTPFRVMVPSPMTISYNTQLQAVTLSDLPAALLNVEYQRVYPDVNIAQVTIMAEKPKKQLNLVNDPEMTWNLEVEAQLTNMDSGESKVIFYKQPRLAQGTLRIWRIEQPYQIPFWSNNESYYYYRVADYQYGEFEMARVASLVVRGLRAGDYFWQFLRSDVGPYRDYNNYLGRYSSINPGDTEGYFTITENDRSAVYTFIESIITAEELEFFEDEDERSRLQALSPSTVTPQSQQGLATDAATSVLTDDLSPEQRAQARADLRQTSRILLDQGLTRTDEPNAPLNAADDFEELLDD